MSEKKIPRLKEKYEKEVVPALMKEFGYKNKHQVPKIVKIVVNMGLGEAVQNPKVIEFAMEDLRAITGQQPVVRKARRSIAGFKLRAGMRIGCSVTLRRDRMYYFFERLLAVALPRVRDFRGLSPRSFDGKGNYTLGLKEQSIFPEINYDKIDKFRGMNVTIVTTAKTDEEGYALLKYMGMPFKKR